MSLREFVIKEYQATVRNRPDLPRELKEALAVNERVPAFVDKLCHEFSQPFFKNYSNNALKTLIKDATDFFLALVQQRANEKMMSEVEKMAIKQQIADEKILNNAADTGIIDEEVIDVFHRQAKKET